MYCVVRVALMICSLVLSIHFSLSLVATTKLGYGDDK